MSSPHRVKQLIQRIWSVRKHDCLRTVGGCEEIMANGVIERLHGPFTGNIP